MTKTCEICGAKFEPRYNLQNWQKCCNKACSKELIRRGAQERRATEKYKQQRRARYWREHAERVKCRICGQIIPPLLYNGKRPRYHEACVVKDCLNTLRRGERLSKTQTNRAYTRGISVKDLRAMLAEEAEA